MTFQDKYRNNLIADWDFRTGSLKNQQGTGEDGSVDLAPYWNQTRKGRSLVFSGHNERLTVSGSTIYAPTSTPWTVSMLTDLRGFNTNSFPGLVLLKTPTTYSFRIGYSNFGSYLGFMFGSRTSWGRFATNQAESGLFGLHHVSLSFDGVDIASSSSFSVVFDGVAQSISTAGGFAATTNSTIIGSANVSGSYGDGGILQVQVFDTNLTSSEQIELYTQSNSESHLTSIPEKTLNPDGSRDISFFQNGLDWNVTLSDVTAGFISNTGWAITSGTWAVADSDDGGKELICVSSGIISHYGQQTFGTWEWDHFCPSGKDLVFTFMANDIPNYELGYSLGSWSVTDLLYLARRDSGAHTDLFKSVAVATSTWLSLKVTRTSDGVFTIYKDGVLLDVNAIPDGTSNPTSADLNYITTISTAINAQTGAKIRNFKFKPSVDL